MARKEPLSGAMSLRLYWMSIRLLSIESRSVCLSRVMLVLIAAKSSGEPSPYRHDTLDTTITSFRVMSELDAERRSFSSSSFIDESFAM